MEIIPCIISFLILSSFCSNDDDAPVSLVVETLSEDGCCRQEILDDEVNMFAIIVDLI